MSIRSARSQHLSVRKGQNEAEGSSTHTDSTEQLCARLGDQTHSWHRRTGRLHHAWLSVSPLISTSPPFLSGSTSRHQPLWMGTAASHNNTAPSWHIPPWDPSGAPAPEPPPPPHPAPPSCSPASRHTQPRARAALSARNPAAAAAAPAPHPCHPRAAPAAPHHDVVTLHLRFLAGEFVAFQLQAGKAESSERTTSRRAAGRILRGPSQPAVCPGAAQQTARPYSGHAQVQCKPPG